MIRTQLLPSLLVGSSGQIGGRGTALSVQFGPAGRCPGEPTLTTFLFDDSGSIGAVGGNDPVGRRYDEVRIALEAMSRRCRCGEEAVALVHFDTPTSRDVGPTCLGGRGCAALEKGLGLPVDAQGNSSLKASLTRAYELAAQHPKHKLVLCVLSDYWLFDQPPELERLAEFPGVVYAICLRAEPPPELVADDRVQIVRIDYRDPPGKLAHAAFASLKTHRRTSRGDRKVQRASVFRGRQSESLLP